MTIASRRQSNVELVKPMMIVSRQESDVELFQQPKKRMRSVGRAGMMMVNTSRRQSNVKLDDRNSVANGRRSTLTSEPEGEEFSLSEADDSDGTPTAKRSRATATDEAPIVRILFTRYSAGTKVKKFFKGYGWFLGEIASSDEEHCCYVRYEDGDEENYLVDELEDLDKIVANVARTRPHCIVTDVVS
jgi:hypothetical protein